MNGFELAAAFRENPQHLGAAGHRDCRRWSRPMRSSAGATLVSTISSPSSIAPGSSPRSRSRATTCIRRRDRHGIHANRYRFHRVCHLYHRRSDVRSADRARAGRVQADAHDARAAGRAEIAGVLNLRGRIVTAIDMRNRLEVKQREGGDAPMAIGIEAKGESFGLLVDAVGEVLKLSRHAARAQSGQPRPQARGLVGRSLPARWSATGRARRRPGAGSAQRGGSGMSKSAHARSRADIEAGSPAKRRVRTR